MAAAPLYVERLLGQLKKVRKDANGWEACCPHHDDQTPSLNIAIAPDGKILIHCKAGCTYKQVVEAIGLHEYDLWPPREEGRVVATYDYQNANGLTLYRKLRFDPKHFLIEGLLESGVWVKGKGETKSVLYRLPELIASDPNEIVWVVEGEKAADRLAELGLVVTCSGGAESWSRRFAEWFKNRTVVVLPDNDNAGEGYANKVIDSIKVLASRVKVVRLPDLPAGGDVFDWLTNGGTKEKLIELASQEKEEKTYFHFTPRIEWPTAMRQEAFAGIAGEFVRRIESETEADPVAILIQFLVAFGNIVGRGPYFLVEKTRHYLNLFCVLVGRTARGRKGTAMGWVDYVFSQVGDNYWSDKRCLHGLSSGEGLIWEVRDQIEKVEKGETVIVDEGEPDKRLLVVEQEFASVLQVAAREGNTLSTCIRQSWDSGKLRIMTKHSRAKASGAHISIIGHVTKAELVKRMKEVEVANGFANRFLWACVRRSKLLPHGGQDVYLMDLIKSLQALVQVGKRVDKMARTPEANQFWESAYKELNEEVSGAFGMATDRAGAQALRLSCLYAILDSSPEIRPEHIESALAVWTYCRDSARYVFGESTGQTDADDILQALREAGSEGMSRMEISVGVFQRNKSSSQISSALNNLQDYGLAESSIRNGKGRPTEIWKVTN